MKQNNKKVFLLRAESAEDKPDYYIALYIISTSKINLPAEYENYTDVFSEAEVTRFLDLIRVKYLILIKKEKKVLFGLIYKLSANKLRVLREYINSNIAKK